VPPTKGGGFVEGDKDEYRYYCMNLVRNRYAVINFSYRLAPEYPFPACVSDLEKVMHWADKHSAEYGLDTAHVFALGDSAGGHILALYAALITGPNDDGLYINHPKNVSLRALGLNSAELQIPEVKKLSTAQRHMFSDLMGQELSEQLLDKVRLEHRITKDFPAVYMIAGNKDPMCARIPAFCRLLSEKGVEHRCKIYGTEESPLGHVFFLDIRKKISEEATNDELNYFMEMYSQKNI